MAASESDHRTAFQRAVEEVVGGGRHDGAVAEVDRQRGQEQGGVEVAGVVGGEDHRRLDVAEVLVSPRTVAGASDAGRRPGHVVEDHGPRQAGRVAPRPVVVVVEADLALGCRPIDPGRPGRRRAEGSGRAPDRSAARSVPSVHVRHARSGGVCRWVKRGRRADHVARDLERVVQRARPARSPADEPPRGRRRPRSPGPGARGRARTSTTCRRDGRRGRRGRSGRGGCTRGRWRRTPRSCLCISDGIGRLGEHLLVEVDVARVVAGVEVRRVSGGA